ncbi:Similar to Uncharacterized beta-glucan synthesis-associated protein C17G6.11c; acc. no. O13789 [Pyronema omphalodes CBS 100304]|uniref:Similar to Uncharacterized beta-glucan synthesis-associated protein C17G6.11c acc. no. O13789 n=1 Tax=Pyronema omphalodes (strain CBS 100304) TaxID=1076935 RepID=U4KZZ2_PYROM|nr:Similar to Uncharacterized beta-glucan synthesis-associated protein C17G6.11c; acc. no. O13789 [Pyronema omphalodes CBS 100304]
MAANDYYIESLRSLHTATIKQYKPRPHLTKGTIIRIDYVRIYQKEGEEILITCNPYGFSTIEYIKNHPKAYLG